MAVRFDPKIGGPTTPGGVTSEAGDPGATAKQAPRELAAMDKPKALPTPDAAPLRPDPQRAPGRDPEKEKLVAELKAALKTTPAQRLAAARAILGRCLGYELRRSRAGRRAAVELCDAVAEEVPELAAAARLLEGTLLAEGLLQDCTPEATLRALQSLVEMLARLEAPEAG